MSDPDAVNAFESDMLPTDARTNAEASVEQLRVRGGVFVEAVRATRMAMVLTDPALPGNPIIFANESFLTLSGYNMDEVHGQQPFFLNGPDTNPRDAARFRQALAEDHDETLQTIQYRKDGSRMVVSLFLTALKDDDGRTLHHLLSWRDISRQTAAEDQVDALRESQAALRASEARNSLLVGSWAQAVWETDHQGVVIADSPSWRAYTGQTLEEWLGYGWLDAIHPDDRAYAKRQWREATAAQGLVNAEFRLCSPNGDWRWTNVRAAPVLDANGDVEKWVGMNIDIDDRKRAEAELREGEERQAFQLRLSDALALLSDPADIEATAARLVAEQLGVGWCYFNEFNERGTHATVQGEFHHDGLPSMVGVHDLSGERDFLNLMRSDATLDMPDLTMSEQFSAQAKAHYSALGIRSALGVPLLRNGRLAAVLLVADTSVRRWARGDAELLRGIAERTWDAIQRSRTQAALGDSKRHQGLLLAELQHRVRNTLTMVRSVARRTSENCADIDDYVRHLDGRLAALARIQTIITREPGRGVDLHDMLLDELTSQAALPTLTRVEGPKVELSLKAAEVLSLALHELTTNSTKYGVLSESVGTIVIRWMVDDREGQQWLRLTWHEPVNARSERPKRTGFGTDLIVNRVPYELRGQGHLRVENTWVEARIEFPLNAQPASLQFPGITQ